MRTWIARHRALVALATVGFAVLASSLAFWWIRRDGSPLARRDIENGRLLYQANCSGCHGPDGDSVANGHAARFAVSRMPACSDSLNRQELADVVSYRDAHRTFTPRACRASCPKANAMADRTPLDPSYGGTDHPRPSCGEESDDGAVHRGLCLQGRQLGDRAFIRPIVLLGGHAQRLLMRPRLTIEEARALCPLNNATSLQTAAGVLRGVVWAIRHPREGVVDPDDGISAR